MVFVTEFESALSNRDGADDLEHGLSPDDLGQLDDFPHDDLEISISRSSELRHLPWGSMVSEVVTPLCRA